MDGLNLKDPQLLRSQAFVNGEWIDADSGGTIAVNNPATGQPVGTVPMMGAAEARRAIEGADIALSTWRKTLAKERGRLLRKWFDLIIDNADDLALILTSEQGKTLAEAKSEVVGGAAFIEWFAEEARRTYGETIPTPAQDRRVVVIKQPIGVCVAITPWNFPNTIITRKAGAALAAGCTIVVRPASTTPFTALALAHLAARAGIPPGVFSVVTGGSRDIGAEFTSNPIVRKISFTGSTQVGRALMAQSAGTIKKLALELGGNAPFIVFEDADIDAAVTGAMGSKFRNSGQACVGTNRFYIHDSVYDAFVSKFLAEVAKLKVGNGVEPDVTFGPVHDIGGVRKTEDHIADALAKGAQLLAGGKRHALGGTFFEPTVIGEANASMKVASEETFGPLASIFRFHDEDELIKAANDTELGLASYFYSRDIGRIWRVAEALETGMVGVNIGLMANEAVPFGGIKESGVGREGSHYGIEDYMEVKYICMAGI
ncbi:NAD-dependent succinate-semialdehyde dehydrogenase (plasmid) [Rhizobium ruizarguesonis]|uniref:NAD-dependent succinate-semialdehyde dehydrogenase n=1 Tax=Rhizobium TaxID=379 RepID=UPI0010310C60|nr:MULTISPECIES: NAD-dependent succinate-semialdehyde dehydrogenase [Rhizobium]MBB3649132.1 succinate-semialdehyde dehydrogenase/glutarate-semialdehyde dehydrogenase [Rhizobium sp. BK619]TBB14925.1 NAD-dependent succinate-semialdehyde dehydrogenase [Rhizobium ruizarguesonis]